MIHWCPFMRLELCHFGLRISTIERQPGARNLQNHQGAAVVSTLTKSKKQRKQVETSFMKINAIKHVNFMNLVLEKQMVCWVESWGFAAWTANSHRWWELLLELLQGTCTTSTWDTLWHCEIQEEKICFATIWELVFRFVQHKCEFHRYTDVYSICICWCWS